MLAILGIIVLIVVIGGLMYLVIMDGIKRRRPTFNSSGISQLEEILLMVLFEHVEPELAHKLKAQLAYFGFQSKKRAYQEKSMSLEFDEDPKSPLSEEFRLDKKADSNLASIQFKLRGERYTAKFCSLEGRLWGWTISPNPKFVLNANSIEVNSKEVNIHP